MEPDEYLGLEKRRRVYQEIVAHPGLHLRELERRLGLGLGDLRFHLDFLERKGLIRSRTDGYRKTYVEARDLTIPDAAILALLRQSAPRAIVLFLMEHGPSLFDEVRAHLNVSKSTLSFHMRKLVDAFVVLADRREARNVYRVAERERVARMIIAYRTSFLDEAIDRVARAWMP